MKRLAFKAAAASAMASALPMAASAQTYDYDYEYDLTTTEATGLLAGLGIFFVVFLIIGLVSLVFWILMLVHAIKNDIPDKNMWLIILLVSFVAGLGLIGALVYYFTVKRKFEAPKAQSAKDQPNHPQK